MGFIATYERDFILWDYILGEPYQKMSIALDRWEFLQNLSWDGKNKLKISCRDPDTNRWTKWVQFPGLLYERRYSKYGSMIGGLAATVDVHRSVLPNEIVIESDYPEYVKNQEASRLIGSILEGKGFKPSYYYSGNKSVHIHVFLDWNFIGQVEKSVRDKIKSVFKDNQNNFRLKFMEWLRERMISCWGTNAREFDTALVKATHLIRCELSKNKRGFKTFIGHTYKDLSFVPQICNEKNRIYPRMGKMRLSVPNEPTELLEEFLESLRIKNAIYRSKMKSSKPIDFNSDGKRVIRRCVNVILNDDFKSVNDGYHRAMFILVNELKQCYSDDKAKEILDDWNVRMGSPVKQADLDYRLKLKEYILTTDYIEKFLGEVGVKF